MAKKIYDIKPPKLTKKVEKEIKDFLAQEKNLSARIKAGKPTRRKSPSGLEEKTYSIWLPISIGIVVLVLVVGIFLFFKLPKADIAIWPKVDTLSFQQTIIAEKSVDSVNVAKAVIPAQYFETSKTVSQDFPSTGNATDAGRASGTITVYNKYNPVAPITLKSGTHFMSDSGKLFVSLQKVVIPAAKKSGSKIIPSSVQVNVRAVEGGDSYNIAPSNFSVPGLKGSDYYYSIYATSAVAMTGGYTGKIKKVTDDDIQLAKDTLVKKATDDAEAELKGQVSSDYILLDNAISTSTTSASTQTKTGTVVDNFTYQVTIKANCLAFKKADLDKFGKDYIISKIPEGKTLLQDSFKINYSATTVDISGGKETLSVDFSSGVYENIDKNSMELSLIGKNVSQINETINSRLGENVSKIDVNLWPFWVTSSPNNQKAVKIQLKF